MQVLVCLAQHAPQPLTREQILERVWGDVVVNEETLTGAISDLRKAFGDDSKHPHVIETIRKVGYRLILSVQWPEEQGPARHDPADRSLQTSYGGASSPKIRWRSVQYALVGLAVIVGCVGFWVARKNPSSVPFEQGGRPLPLTSMPGLERHPALSPDGVLVAFVWEGEAKDNLDIYVKQRGAASPMRLTASPEADLHPAWSPDGRSLAFKRINPTTYSCALFLISFPEGHERKLADCEEAGAAIAWSPEGTYIAYADRQGPGKPHQLFLLNTQTLQVRPLTTPGAPYLVDDYPAFSSDGKALVFIRGVREGAALKQLAPIRGHIVRMALEGGDPHAVTYEEQDLFGLTWLFEEDEILFAADRGRDAYGLWRVPARGGASTMVVAGEGAALRHPTAALYGSRVAYEQWDSVVDIWRLALRGEAKPERIIASTRWDYHPRFSPDGSAIAFISTRTGFRELWVASADGGNPLQLTAFEGAQLGAARWSPDGQALALSVQDDEHSDIFTIPAQGGVARRVTKHPADDLQPSWSRDGAWLYFSSNRSGTWQIWKVPVAGGTPSQVTRNGGFMAVEGRGASGPQLYFTRLDVPGVWMRDVAGADSASHRITQSLSAWALRDSLLYFVEAQHGSTRLYAFDLVSETLQPLGDVPLPEDGLIVNLDVSPDGKTVLLAEQDRLTGDLMYISRPRHHTVANRAKAFWMAE